MPIRPWWETWMEECRTDWKFRPLLVQSPLWLPFFSVRLGAHGLTRGPSCYFAPTGCISLVAHTLAVNLTEGSWCGPVWVGTALCGYVYMHLLLYMLRVCVSEYSTALYSMWALHASHEHSALCVHSCLCWCTHCKPVINGSQQYRWK